MKSYESLYFSSKYTTWRENTRIHNFSNYRSKILILKCYISLYFSCTHIEGKENTRICNISKKLHILVFFLHIVLPIQIQWLMLNGTQDDFYMPFKIVELVVRCKRLITILRLMKRFNLHDLWYLLTSTTCVKYWIWNFFKFDHRYNWDTLFIQEWSHVFRSKNWHIDKTFVQW